MSTCWSSPRRSSLSLTCVPAPAPRGLRDDSRHVSDVVPGWKDLPVDSADVRAFFERVSRDWDSMRSSFYNEKVIDALAERAEVTTTSQVVDVGTGTGFVAAGLAPRAAAVLGVDNSAAMLAVAERNLRALNLGNVRLAKGELDALPLDDNSVDAAVANMVLHHAPDPPAML